MSKRKGALAVSLGLVVLVGAAAAAPTAADLIDEFAEATAATADDQADALSDEAAGLPDADVICSASVALAAMVPGAGTAVGAHDAVAASAACRAASTGLPQPSFVMFVEVTLEAWDPVTSGWSAGAQDECLQPSVAGTALIASCVIGEELPTGHPALQRVRRGVVRVGVIHPDDSRAVHAIRYTAPLPPHTPDLSPRCTITATVTADHDPIPVPVVGPVAGRMVAAAGIRCLSDATSYVLAGQIIIEACDPDTLEWITVSEQAFSSPVIGTTATVVPTSASTSQPLAGWRVTWTLHQPNHHSASATSVDALCD